MGTASQIHIYYNHKCYQKVLVIKFSPKHFKTFNKSNNLKSSFLICYKVVYFNEYINNVKCSDSSTFGVMLSAGVILSERFCPKVITM